MAQTLPGAFDQQGVNIPIQGTPNTTLQPGAAGQGAAQDQGDAQSGQGGSDEGGSGAQAAPGARARAFGQAAPGAEAALQGVEQRRPAFVFEPNASLQGTFTDNAFLTQNSRKSDWITTPSGGIDVTGKTERSQINGTYSVSGDFYAADSQLNGYRQNLLTVDKFDVVKDAFSVELRGSIDQEDIAQTGQLAATERSGLGNQTQVANATITPKYVNKFGNWAVGTLSYSLNRVAYFNGGNNATPNNLSNSTQQNIAAELASGSIFTQLTWRLGLSDAISRGNDTHLNQQTAEIDSEYRINSMFRVPASVGYDNFAENQSAFSSSSLSGVFWNTGLHLVPGPRTELTLRYGRRYDKPYENGTLTYKILPNMTLTATYDVVVQTQQQSLANSLQGVVVDANGNFVNPIGGLPAAPNQTGNNLVNAVYRARNFQFGVSGSHGLNFFSLNGLFETRDFGGVIGSDRTQGINGTLGRNLSPLTTVTFIGQLEHTIDTGTLQNIGSNVNLLTGLDLDHKLSERTDLAFDVTRRHQYGTTRSDEDAFVIRLSHKF